MTAANASRSLLKSAAAVAAAAGRIEVKMSSGAGMAVIGAETVDIDVDDDDVDDDDSFSSDVCGVANDVSITGTGTRRGALYLQNPAAFALATRMFLSCFSV